MFWARKNNKFLKCLSKATGRERRRDGKEEWFLPWFQLFLSVRTSTFPGRRYSPQTSSSENARLRVMGAECVRPADPVVAWPTPRRRWCSPRPRRCGRCPAPAGASDSGAPAQHQRCSAEKGGYSRAAHSQMGTGCVGFLPPQEEPAGNFFRVLQRTGVFSLIVLICQLSHG